MNRRFSAQPPMEPPENFFEDPCDKCEICGGKVKAPEGMRCDENGTYPDECPKWNPEPIKCDACGRHLRKIDDSLCKECQNEEFRQKFESGEFDNLQDYGLDLDRLLSDDDEYDELGEYDEFAEIEFYMNPETYEFEIAYLTWAWALFSIDIRLSPEKVTKYPVQLLISLTEEDLNDGTKMDNNRT